MQLLQFAAVLQQQLLQALACLPWGRHTGKMLLWPVAPQYQYLKLTSRPSEVRDCAVHRDTLHELAAHAFVHLHRVLYLAQCFAIL